MLTGVIPPPPPSPARVCMCSGWCRERPTVDVWVATEVPPTFGYWAALAAGPEHEARLRRKEPESDDGEQDGGDQQPDNEQG